MEGPSQTMATIKSLLSKTGGIMLLLAVVAMSAIIGGLAMFFHLTGSLPTTLRGAATTSELDADREGRVGLVDEIEMTFADASLPVDEDAAEGYR
jgi:hypothetical protein